MNNSLFYNEKPIISGSSKDFYETNDPNIFKVIFKDVIHGRGREDTLKGTGRLREEFCYYFYNLLEKEGIKTQLAPNALAERGIFVKKLTMLPLELIVRYVSRGYWVDAHKWPLLPQGITFDAPVVEYCVKWKKQTQYLPYEQLSSTQKKFHAFFSHLPVLQKILMPTAEIKDDPRVNLDMILTLNKYAKDDYLRGHLLQNADEERELRKLALKVNNILKEFLNSLDFVLEDGKFEVGFFPHSRDFIVADEYTQDSSRIRDKFGASLSKDLFRQQKSKSEIYDGYALLTEGIKNYVK